MKKIVALVLISILSLSCKKTQENPQGFSIVTHIDGIPDGRKVFLKKQKDRKIIVLDTTEVKNGQFTFHGTLKEPLILGIFIDSINRGGIFPFIDIDDQIQITAYKDSLIKSKIEGSVLNKELTRLRTARDILAKKTQAFLPEFQKANQAKDTVTINKINKKVKIISNQMDANDWDYVKKHPNSYVTALVFNGLLSKPQYKDSIIIVYNSFSDKIKNAELTKPVRNYIEYLEKQKNKSVK